MTERVSRGPFGVFIALLLALIAAAALATAYTYGRSSGFFPKFIGWIFIGLVLTELSIQLKSFLDARRESATESVTARAAVQSSNVAREIKGFLWLGSLLTAVYLVGFLIVTPLFIFSFLRISAGKSVRECTVASVVGCAFVYLVFVVLLDYRLFGGVLLAV
jgi:hypothetical protein